MPTLMIHHHTTQDTFSASVYFGLPPSHSKIGRVHAREITDEEAKRPLEDLLKDWMSGAVSEDKAPAVPIR